MPSVKRNVKSQEKKTGFEAYDGPEIPARRAIYRAHLKQLLWKVAGTGTVGYRVLVELEAEKSDPKSHAQYDGYPIWGNLWLGDKEAMLTREGNFYASLGVADNPAVNFNDDDTSKGAKILSLGGKKMEALMKVAINVDVKPSTDPNYPGFEIDSIYPFKGAASGPKFVANDDEPDEDDSDVVEDADDEVVDGEEVDEEFDARAQELDKLGIGTLRTIAKEAGIVTTKLSKDDLVEAILDAEFPEDGAAVLEDDEDVEEADEIEEDEDEVEEDDEEESDDEDASAARSAELAGFDRVALKKIIKAAQPDYKIFARHTDDDLRAAIIDQEFGDETPF